MQKPFESRTKTKQNYWFLTNETTYLNGQQPHGRRDCRRGRRRRGEPEVRKTYRKLTKRQQFHKTQSTRFHEETGAFAFLSTFCQPLLKVGTKMMQWRCHFSSASSI